MARYVLYGSNDGNRASSIKSTASNAFNITTQKNAYTNVNNTTKPLKESDDIDKVSAKSTHGNVYMDYNLDGKESISTIRTKLSHSLNIFEMPDIQTTFARYNNYYNRFKLPTVNDAFQKGFAHVFFTRPDCNLLERGSISKLNQSFADDPKINYIWKNDMNLIKQLCHENGQNHDFMLSLSNKAASFSLSNEYINTDTYGKSFKGWQIAYGRNNVESKTAGDFSITFNDDRNLHVYLIHKLWVDYISDVYQGKKSPKIENIKDKTLDYASSCYYLITAEDGETIIFWSKYYGIFPTEIPSSQFAWAQGNIIEKPQLDIKYQFSFKEDMNPEAIAEFNINSRVKENRDNNSLVYVPTYDPKLGHVGTTWVGAPYIETVTDYSDPQCPYTFKLRFRPK